MKGRRGRLPLFSGCGIASSYFCHVTLSLKLPARVKQKSQVEIAHGQAVVRNASHHCTGSLQSKSLSWVGRLLPDHVMYLA